MCLFFDQIESSSESKVRVLTLITQATRSADLLMFFLRLMAFAPVMRMRSVEMTFQVLSLSRKGMGAKKVIESRDICASISPRDKSSRVISEERRSC